MRHDAQAVLATAQHLEGLLTVAIGPAEGGRRIDLSGLDREIAALCLAALGLRGAERRQCRLPLLSLQRRVEVLQALAPQDAARRKRGG